MKEEATTVVTDEPVSIIDRLIVRLQQIVRSKYGLSMLAAISLIESMLPVPILTDPFLAGAIMVDRARAWRLVLVTLVSSVVGGLLAFIMAALFRDWLLLVVSPEIKTVLNALLFEEQGTLLLTLVGAITPVPYTLVAWAVALSAGNPFIFIIGSLLGRSVRYGIVGWCAYQFGPAALQYARKSIWLTSVVVIVLFVAYVLLKL